MKNHQEMKWCRPCQIALKHFVLTKKKKITKNRLTFKIGVDRTKLIECYFLEKKKKAKIIPLQKVTKNSVRSSEKRGVELEKEDQEYSAPTKLTFSHLWS